MNIIKETTTKAVTTKEENFRANLMDLQIENELSNKDIGEVMECTGGYVSMLRTGKANPSQRLVENLAAFIEIKPEELFKTPDERRQAERRSYGKRVAAARERRGLTGKDMAGILGMTPTVYYNLERGTTSATKSNKQTIQRVLFDVKDPVTPVKTTPPKPEVRKEPEAAAPAAAKPSELPSEVIETLIKHVTDLKIDPQIQRKIFRVLSEYKIAKEEETLFGKEVRHD